MIRLDLRTVFVECPAGESVPVRMRTTVERYRVIYEVLNAGVVVWRQAVGKGSRQYMREQLAREQAAEALRHAKLYGQMGERL